MLISVNPYKTIDGLYNLNTAVEAATANDNATSERPATAAATPHVYVVAERALSQMLLADRGPGSAAAASQSIVISGEPPGAPSLRVCARVCVLALGVAGSVVRPRPPVGASTPPPRLSPRLAVASLSRQANQARARPRRRST